MLGVRVRMKGVFTPENPFFFFVETCVGVATKFPLLPRAIRLVGCLRPHRKKIQNKMKTAFTSVGKNYRTGENPFKKQKLGQISH